MKFLKPSYKMAIMKLVVRILFIITLVPLTIPLISCGKKDSPPPASEGGDKKRDDPAPQSPVPVPIQTPPTPPVVEEPLPTPGVTESIVTQLIKEIRRKYFLKTSEDMDDEEIQRIATQKTNNLILAKTLKQVDLSFDSEGLPEFTIETQEGSFKFEILPQTEKNKYILKSEQGFISRLFSSSEITYTANIEVRGRYNSIAIIELTRSTTEYNSTVYILHLKKSGRLEIGTHSREDLLRDSSRLLQNLSTLQTVHAHFYHVMTEELDSANQSEATRFSLFFDIYFSLHSQNQTQGYIPLKKSTIYYGSQNSTDPSFWGSVEDFFHNSNAHRQGYIHTISEASYTPSSAISPIEQDPLIIDLSIKNKTGALKKKQRLQFKIHFK